MRDNFRYVLGTERLLSSQKLPQIMFKIDLATAFDSVGWVFLLDLLVVVGCPHDWTNRSPPFVPLLVLESFSVAPRGNEFAMVAVFGRGTLSLPCSSCL
jgi:hypothetical protein